MYIGGMFERSANKLGPLICRDTYEQLDLPHLGASAGSAGLCRMPVIQFGSIRFITFTYFYSPCCANKSCEGVVRFDVVTLRCRVNMGELW